MKVKNKKKGFTLVELLAALVILGLLTAVAAPNIIGILQSTKLNTYIEDAGKLKTLAEYKFRQDTSVVKPPNGQCIIMSMAYLGDGEFKNAPYSGEAYDPTHSFVVIKRADDAASGTIKYVYYVQLMENFKSKYSGIQLKLYDDIKSDTPTSFINTGLSSTTNITSSGPSNVNAGGTCNVKKRYYQ